MPTDAEVIAQARSLLNDIIYPYMKDADYDQTPKATLLTFCAKQTMVIEQLADIAEKRGEMLYDAYAAVVATCDGYEELTKDECLNEAKEILGIKERQWRKIGPDDVAGLDQARLWLEDILETETAGRNDAEIQSLTKICEVLRRLILEE